MAEEIGDSGLLTTWASSGDKTAPDVSKMAQGWLLAERPAYEYMNWLQSEFGKKLNHLLMYGGAVWNATTTYPVGAMVTHSGEPWVALIANDNSTPTAVNVNWKAAIYTHPNHTGDVTSVGDGAMVIADNAVTVAKMADMATASIMGRDTAGLGSPEILAKATVLSILNVADGADVTGTANVTAAGALMDSELTNLAAVKAINQQLTTTSTVAFSNLSGTNTGDETVATTSTAGVVEKATNAEALAGTVADKYADVVGMKAAQNVLQVANYQTGAFASGTTIIPADDTIPQITEGDQYMSLAFTPISATSRLIIDVALVGSNTLISTLIMALFEGIAPNALAVVVETMGANYTSTLSLTHEMGSVGTSELTFKVRAGRNLTGTTYFNGASGARLFGGVAASSITITEVR